MSASRADAKVEGHPPSTQQSPSTVERPLAELRPGDVCIVRKVQCERALNIRLLELGLVPGTRVELRRVAPLGDPMELALRGYALSIRRQEAMHVLVEPLTERA